MRFQITKNIRWIVWKHTHTTDRKKFVYFSINRMTATVSSHWFSNLFCLFIIFAIFNNINVRFFKLIRKFFVKKIETLIFLLTALPFLRLKVHLKFHDSRLLLCYVHIRHMYGIFNSSSIL